jgi:putative transposase
MEAKNVDARQKRRALGVREATLYYKRKMPERDHALRREIEEVLRRHPSYGHKRIARHLKRNKKPILRVMKLFGIKPYRRRGRKWRRVKPQSEQYLNLLRLVTPSFEGCVWAADFTHLAWKDKDVCVATVIDLFSRKVMGAAVSTSHGAPLVIQAFGDAILSYGRPAIFHSDNGSEYHARPFRELLETLGIAISRSKKGCPWENGYQESFYNQFKIDLGDPHQFQTLGELTAAIYETLYRYNNERIHSALHMPPSVFARLNARATMKSFV